MGRPFCRAPLSIDLLLKPSAAASGETDTPVPDVSCGKRARREVISGDLSLAGEDRRSSQLGVVESED
jgi:hypothetical protein